MSAARHFFKAGTASDSNLQADIESDVAAARRAQRDAEAAGQHHTAQQMSAAADEYLDELTDLKGGTWRPKHAG